MNKPWLTTIYKAISGKVNWNLDFFNTEKSPRSSGGKKYSQESKIKFNCGISKPAERERREGRTIYKGFKYVLGQYRFFSFHI